MPNEVTYFSKMFCLELYDVYAVMINHEWYRFQAIKIEDDNVTGILIDLGVEWSATISDVKFLPQKFLKVPSQVK